MDLADFARELDAAELERMSEGDTSSTEYLKFLQVPLTPINLHAWNQNVPCLATICQCR